MKKPFDMLNLADPVRHTEDAVQQWVDLAFFYCDVEQDTLERTVGPAQTHGYHDERGRYHASSKPRKHGYHDATGHYIPASKLGNR